MAIRGFIGILALAGLVFLSVSAPVRADTPLLFIPTYFQETTISASNFVAVFHPESAEILHEVPLGTQVQFTAVDHDTGRVFLSAPDDPAIYALDAASGALVQTLVPEYSPWRILVDDLAGELYVATNDPVNAIHVLDPATLETLRTLELDEDYLWDIALYPELGIVFARQFGDVYRLRMLDGQTGAEIDVHTGGSPNRMLGMDRPTGWLVNANIAGMLVQRITADGFQESFVTEFPEHMSSMLVDSANRRVFIAKNDILIGVDLDSLYAIQPNDLDGIDHDILDIFAGGAMDIGTDNRLYVTNDPLPTPAGGGPRFYGTFLRILDPTNLSLIREIHIPTGGQMLSRGAFTAGKALPNPPAIPTLHPAGIALLILAMAGLALRRYLQTTPPQGA